MLRTVSSLALIALMSGSAFAATTTCSKQPASKFAPKSQLIDILKREGLKVHRIKTENGCYEIYASKSDGSKVNIAVNAVTLRRTNNPEAGEN